MSEKKTFRPNLRFLEKVEANHVFRSFSWKAKTGGRYSFIGGEATARAHAGAGLIHFPHASPSLGRPTFATLTTEGALALVHLRSVAMLKAREA